MNQGKKLVLNFYTILLKERREKMKKVLVKMISVCVIMVIFMCSTFCVLAAESPNITINFEDGTSCGFIPPGDLNADGRIAAEDLGILRKILFNTTKESYSAVYAQIGSTAKYSDANGDGRVNILDLVRAKNCSLKIFMDLTAGTNDSVGMNINGNVSYNKELSNLLQEDKYYRISFTYKAEEKLVLTIQGISDQVYTFVANENTKWQTKSYLFATSEEFISTSDIELQIRGMGIVDDISITPCNVDNDISDIW